MNADQFPLLHEQMGDRHPAGTPTVGVWAWEVEAFPEWMARSPRLVDEIWVYSDHAARALASVVDVPVHVFAPPITVADLEAPDLDRTEVDRDALGLTDDFLFLFCFDFLSGFERKNPLAVIEAFQRAFTPGEGPRLLVKSVNGERGTGRDGAPRRRRRQPHRHRDSQRSRERRGASALDAARATATCHSTAPRDTDSPWRKRWRRPAP